MSHDETSTTKLAQRYPKGTVLTGRVRHLESFGAFLTLEDGTAGIIRNRDLSWEKELEHPKGLLNVGQIVKILVLGVDSHRQPPRLELSLRQAERDPWQNIEQRYQVGQVVRCQVVRLLHTGAFVELEPAVDGFVPLHEVSQFPPDDIDEAIWIGDTIEAVITRLDHEERQIRLSPRQRLANFELEREQAIRRAYLKGREGGVTSLGDVLSNEERQALHDFFKGRWPGVNSSEEITQAAWSTLAARLPRVLLVDDDSSFRLSLQRLLTRLGHQVEVCDSPEKAAALNGSQSFDLVLMDHSFRHAQQDGLAAARRLLAARPGLPVIIITGINWLERHRDLAEEARAAGARSLLVKPMELGPLHRALEAIVAGREDWSAARMVSRPEKVIGGPNHLSGLTLAQADLARVLQEELTRLQKATGADACVLFHRSALRQQALSQQVRVFAHAGAPLVGYDDSKYELQASPVSQVIESGIHIYEPDTTRNHQWFQHLKILSFTSCLGVPVQGFGPREYALFLFHRHKGHFTPDHLERAQVAGQLIASLIARKEAERVIQQVQPYVFAGQVGSHLVHELNNRLSSILNDTKTLALDHHSLEHDCVKAIAPKQRHETQALISEMQTCIRNLQESGRAMRKITQLYLGLVGAERRAAVDLNDLIPRVVNVLAPIAEEDRVKVLTDLEKDLPATLATGVRLEQAFVNIALNAIQQLHLSKGGGELIIQTRFAQQNSQLPLQVRFTDTGPGIHGQDLDRVFELGFSRRPDGTGLGLFIARSLVEAMGGRISIERSVMMIGTTFLIELPLVVPCVEGASI